MRRLIAIALSFLCIALPLRSIADAAASGKHCPMMQAHVQTDEQPQTQADPHTQQASLEHADTHPTSHASSPSSGGHNCCNDADTVARTGQLCKMGQKCSAPMTYLLPPTMLQVAVATQHTVVAPLSITLHTRPPAAVWRPPSLS